MSRDNPVVNALANAGTYGGDALKQFLGGTLESIALGSSAYRGNLGGEIQRLIKNREDFGTLPPEVLQALGPFMLGTNFIGGNHTPVARDLAPGGPSAPYQGVQFQPAVPDLFNAQSQQGPLQIPGAIAQTEYNKFNYPEKRTIITGKNINKGYGSIGEALGAVVAHTTTGYDIIVRPDGQGYTTRPTPAIPNVPYGSKVQGSDSVPTLDPSQVNEYIKNLQQSTQQPSTALPPVPSTALPPVPITQPGIPSSAVNGTPGPRVRVNPPRPQKFSSETVLGTEPVPGTDEDIVTARVPQSGLAQKIASGESAFTTMRELLEPVVDPRTGLKGPTPISSLGRGKLAATLTGLPGGRTGQEYLIGRTSKLPGLEGDAARKLLSAIGNRSVIARQTGEVGNLAENEQKVIEEAFIPNGSDTEDSARRKVELYLQTYGRAVEALRATGNPDTAKQIWFQGAAQASGISQTTPSTGTTIPQQQNVAPGYNGAPAPSAQPPQRSQPAPSASGTSRTVKLRNGTPLTVIVH